MPALHVAPPAPGNHPSTFCLHWICLLWTVHITGLIQICVWLFSFDIMFSRFIHIVACIGTSCLNNIPSYIHVSIDGHLCCFCFLATVNIAVVEHSHTRISVDMLSVLFNVRPGGCWESCGNSVSNLLSTCQTVFQNS